MNTNNYDKRLFQNDTAYFIESNWRIREVRILKITGEFATIRFADGEGGTRLRISRLYATKEEAEKSIRKR